MTEPRFPIKPLGARVIIRPDPVAKMSGLIHLPETARQSAGTKIGSVVQVGPGLSTAKGVIPVQLKRGDRVFFGEYAGQEVALGLQKSVKPEMAALRGPRVDNWNNFFFKGSSVS